MVNDRAMFSASVFKIMFGVLSGPEALLGFMSFSSFNTPAVEMISGLIGGFLVGSCGSGVSQFFVKTYLNCSSRIFDLASLSMCSCPLCFRGLTLILSCFLDFMKHQKGLVSFF